MGTLVDTWRSKLEGFTLCSRDIVGFLEHWEAEHPACGATREQVIQAVGASTTETHPDAALQAFWNALAQEPKETEQPEADPELVETWRRISLETAAIKYVLRQLAHAEEQVAAIRQVLHERGETNGNAG